MGRIAWNKWFDLSIFSFPPLMVSGQSPPTTRTPIPRTSTFSSFASPLTSVNLWHFITEFPFPLELSRIVCVWYTINEKHSYIVFDTSIKPKCKITIDIEANKIRCLLPKCTKKVIYLISVRKFISQCVSNSSWETNRQKTNNNNMLAYKAPVCQRTSEAKRTN